MDNPFPYTMDNKRYHTWNYYLHRQFGCKVFKAPLNAGFTCPNIDGSKGIGGCTYCSDSGSGDFAGSPSLSPAAQYVQARAQMQKKWPGAKGIAYFQAHTNTYAPVEALRKAFEPVLELDGVLGLSIATRADALPSDVLAYLEELHSRTFLTVELGLQSVHERTARRINRGHTYAEFLTGLEQLHKRGIRVCVHIINGLPGEDQEMMLATAQALALLPIDFLKIHLLHVIRGTVLAEEYGRGEFPLLTLEEYVGIVCSQLELLPPGLVLQRLTGDGAPASLIGPLWSRKKLVVLNEIDKELVRRVSWQGKRFCSP